MKNLPLNEKHLADKLQNVPVPDVDQSWEQMRTLLERDMPAGAAAWSGNRKWWWMGITAVVVMVAAWLTSANNVTNDGLKTNITSEQVAPDGSKANETVSEKSINKDIAAKQPVHDKVVYKQPVPDQLRTKSSAPDISKTGTPVTGQFAANNFTTERSKTNTRTTGKLITNNFTLDLAKTNKPATGKPVTSNLVPDQSMPDQTIPGLSKTADIQLSGEIHSSHEIKTPSINLASAEPPAPANAFTEISIQSTHIAIGGKTDRAFAREVRKKSMKADNRRLSRSSMRGNSGDKEHDITFAAGLTLPHSLPVSGQQTAAYNIAAKNSLVTDYLPAPFFQYHVNDKLFLQTEFQFQSPQHTQRLLLSQNIDTFMSMRYEKTEHLEKLYYFNIPFNVYYSPVRNFYIGGGLQYSSLLGGIATYEDKSSNGPNVVSHNSVTRRFSDDSTAAAFSPSEWRYQLDANYYFNRFSFGLRYNQSMKDYINTQVGPSAVVGRNSSFLLYIRFNIWEERKKTAN